MALSNAIQGANHTGQKVIWSYERGEPVDLTNSVITAKKRIQNTKVVTDVAGQFALVDPMEGVFNWPYAPTDIDTVGVYQIQFIATYTDETLEKSMIEQFTVKEALDVE